MDMQSMLYEKEIDAWYTDSIDSCVCPACKLPISLSYQQCACGALLNCEHIDSEEYDVYIVTIEQDRLQDINEQIRRDDLANQNSLV
jgi:hypothetical protein